MTDEPLSTLLLIKFSKIADHTGLPQAIYRDQDGYLYCRAAWIEPYWHNRDIKAIAVAMPKSWYTNNASNRWAINDPITC